jgi:hypothetical protein
LTPPCAGKGTALKHEIALILKEALSGGRYRGDGFVRWGQVARDIEAAVDAHLESA